ncbi:SNF2 helicase associated domain-containing protein [Cohnella soli]|uniref:SNF2 helicase associated domain-containing protein n=1 Tax=Cohnella soli TaxID=425005 RepID=A0ABW0HTF5_9BACL
MMNAQFTKRTIKQLCGSYSIERGEADYRAGNVKLESGDQPGSSYRAVIFGNNIEYVVHIRFVGRGEVEAHCSCPALDSYDKHCKHVAAALIAILDETSARKSTANHSYINDLMPDRDGIGLTPRSRDANVASDGAISEDLLDLFADQPKRANRTNKFFTDRQLLLVDFIVSPFPYGYRKYMLGIELKVGAKRTYAPAKIRDFLDKLDRGEGYAFSKHFAYAPDKHAFEEVDDAVLRKLADVRRQESMVSETSGSYSPFAAPAGGERMLLVPPSAWKEIAPLLEKARNVKLEHDRTIYEGVRTTREPLPLRFRFDREQKTTDNDDSYYLEVDGLDRLTVLEAYGLVLSEGAFHKVDGDRCRRLSELKKLLERSSGRSRILISRAQTEPFLHQVVPGLQSLGSVDVSRTVNERIFQAPLKAKLFLDRVRDRLLAGLEFHYGDIVVNPLEDGERSRGADRILVRDVERETRILELMDGAGFIRTESGFFMDEEEPEYEFLYRVVPQLETLLHVYATTAVKSRLYVPNSPPRIRVDADEKTDWLDCKFEFEGIPQHEIRNVLKALSEKLKYYKLPGGAFVPLESRDYEEIIRFMNDVGAREADLTEGGMRLPVVRGLHLVDAERPGRSLELGKSFRELLSRMRNPDSLDFPVPDCVAPVLRDYQKLGYQWLRTLAHYRFGGILADDMGLGKTLQSIAYLASVLPEIRQSGMPALVVCPASLTYNWRNELKRFAPNIRVVIADGVKSERTRALKRLAATDVLITSYPLLRRDIADYAGTAFHTLFLDEAQAFKNYYTQTAHAVKSVQALHRFALTGTPVENAAEEIWSIYDVVFPELLPDRKSFAEMPREAISRRIRPFLLRRMKADVLAELPEKIESMQSSEMFPEQKKLYMAYLAKLRKETLKHLNEDRLFGLQSNRIKILAGITRLRQLCCHPALFVEDYEGGSAKFEQLLEIVDECRASGKRALIFSQFTEMLKLIVRELGAQGVPFFYLDGETPSEERVEMSERFNDGERDLFLVSLKAGGTGLNLTGADTVILYDLWWNPAVEQQAADRAHRMGQRKVVHVLRLLAQGTVEEKMYTIQQRKKNLVDELVQPGSESLSTLTDEDIRDILSIP